MFEILKMTLSKSNGSTKAYFNFAYNGLVVNGATVYEGKNGELGIGMPSNKGNDNKYHAICYFRKEDSERLEELKQLAIDKYNKLVNSSTDVF